MNNTGRITKTIEICECGQPQTLDELYDNAVGVQMGFGRPYDLFLWNCTGCRTTLSKKIPKLANPADFENEDDRRRFIEGLAKAWAEE